MVEVVECPRHPGVETGLRCSRCDTPICPRCMIQSPVGARCPDCAKVVKSPVYTLEPATMARAAAASVVGGLVAGFAWVLILLPFTFGSIFFAIIIGVALGYGFSRLMEVATGYKRGPAVVGFATGGMLIAWGVLAVAIGFASAAPALLAVGAGVYFAYQNLR